MPYSEILKTFDESRPEFTPYGLTAEKWKPKRMPRADRHNEIEINLLTDCCITYLITDKKITVPPHRFTVFWALLPHQIIDFDRQNLYYVCTIPLGQFLTWNLPTKFVELILKGNILIERTTDRYDYDKYLIENWVKDVSSGDITRKEITIKEMYARLHRFAINAVKAETCEYEDTESLDLIEKMILYIARNYKNKIKNEDVANAVYRNSDYANAIFKKYMGMTIQNYILHQRILNVKRELSVTNKSIIEIAYESGFNSLSRFNAAFKKICGCTPREYRKKHLYSIKKS